MPPPRITNGQLALKAHLVPWAGRTPITVMGRSFRGQERPGGASSRPDKGGLATCSDSRRGRLQAQAEEPTGQANSAVGGVVDSVLFEDAAFEVRADLVELAEQLSEIGDEQLDFYLLMGGPAHGTGRV